MTARDFAVCALYGIVFVFLTGCVVGGCALVEGLLFGGRGLPRWSLTSYIVAVFVIGCAYIVGEVVFRPIGKILVDDDKVTDPLWKRLLRLLAILASVMVFGLVFVLAVEMAKDHGWIPQWLE